MRLHHLEVSAFGPFAGTVEVDFDELGSTGLFLLTGATGAGKTSILDAVCFGLYGEVPGDRASARALRSDHAAPDAEPRVRLVLGVGDRLLRLTRTAAWDRPRRRGDGTRRVQASVVAEERRDDGWVTLSTRLDETGQLVADLLGMTCRQFTQVVLLPQGRFQAFLRASSAERHAVLQRLFRTERFDDVERWLAEQRRRAGRELEGAAERCTEVLDRLCEAADTERPPAWHEHGGRLAPLLDDGSLERWLDEVERDLDWTQRRREREAAEAAVAVERSTERLLEAQALAGQRRLAHEAGATLARLDAEAAEVEAERGALAAHERALPVLALAHDAAERSETAEAAADDAAGARRRLDPDLRDADESGLAAERELLVGLTALVRGWAERERRISEQRARRDAVAAELDRSARAAQTDRADHATLATELAALAGERARLEPVAQTVAAAAADLERVQAALGAARRCVGLREEVRVAVDRQQALTDHAQRLREEHLALWERRVSGAAAELAGRLAAGCSCPVCGSREHPHPAPRADAVPEATEAEVRARAETAETARLAAGEAVAALRAHLRAAEDLSAGAEVEALDDERERARRREQEARAAAARVETLDHRLDEQRARLERIEVALAAADARQEERTRALARLDEELQVEQAALDELVRALVGDPGAEGASARVADLVVELQRRHETVAAAVAAVRRESEARARWQQSLALAEGAVARAGFDDLAACLAARLDEARAAASAARVEAWHDARSRAEHTWSLPGVADALDLPEPPVAELQAALDAVTARRDDAVAAHRADQHRARRSAALRHELATRCRAWAPLRERHDTVSRLAALTEGTGADNRLRMRLSGYVLAERLRQVVAAANERLATMTEQRFALEHAEEKGAGEQRGGLSLRVRDDWSGTRRDPATLSGGESFQVSLALALGLADTVAHEAGGAALDTLVVDEGFGALDADSLDAVMDVLDGLRDGGRVVGIVSHVSELRDRVPAQLEVRRGRDGSTVGRAVIRG